MTRGLVQDVELRGTTQSPLRESASEHRDGKAPLPAAPLLARDPKGGVPPNKVIGVICSGDLAVHRDTVKSAIERGIEEHPGAVWVCLEAKSDRMTHDVMIALDLEPVVLPLIDHWRVERKQLDWMPVWNGPDPDAWPKKRIKVTLFDGRRKWRDQEMLHGCDPLIVFQKKTGDSPWREMLKRKQELGLHQNLFVVELGDERAKRARKTRKPVGV